ncbi:hypothetical protein SOVF_051360 [Spinacia oleracea]|nr:hypothetical protein SOVF_051360 [Spinacia oleracea]
MTTQFLHPSKAKEFSHARTWALEILLNHLSASSGQDHADAVKVIDHFRFSMFCSLVLKFSGISWMNPSLKRLKQCSTSNSLPSDTLQYSIYGLS